MILFHCRKNVLEKYTKCIDLRETYEDANNTICIRLANVDPAVEYTKFIEQNKTLVVCVENFVLQLHQTF